MNRVIKFRGQDYQGKWHYGSLITLTDDSGELNYFILEGNYELQTMEPFEDFILVKPETVGQFTGLYDKDGKEIYEGDILRMDYPEWDYVVFWEDSRLKWAYRKIGETQSYSLCMSPLELSHYEVIGDIHENPELITKGGNNA